MIVLVNAWTVVFFFTNFLQCYPISVNWTGWGAAVNSCINTNTMFLAQAWSDIFTDGNITSLVPEDMALTRWTVMILSLPLPSVLLSCRYFCLGANDLTDLAASNAEVTKGCCL